MSQRDEAKNLFMAVVNLPADEQARYLDEHCSSHELRREVESLLKHYREAGPSIPPTVVSEEENKKRVPFERLGDFRVLQEIGRGGMGIVYLAVEEELQRLVALKVLTITASLAGEGIKRFKQEARIAAKLRHPAIVPVFRFGEQDGVYYIASEFIEGTTIAAELKRSADESHQPPWTDARGVARLLAPIAEALQFAHERNIIHRDVKPSNLLLDLKGRAYLADFGLAKDISDDSGDVRTRTGHVAGTYYYMSPEQALAKRVPIDHRTDIFSLGVVFYELLTGKRPFEGKTYRAVLEKISFHDPPSLRKALPGLPRDIEVACAKALEKRPEHRYATAGEFALDLHALAAGQPILARPPSVFQRTARFVRQRRVAIGVVAAAAFALAGGLWWGRSSVPSAKQPVQVESRPSGARVWARLYGTDGRFGERVDLGRTPLSTELEPGTYRFVVSSGDGAPAEITRYVHPEAGLAPIHADLWPRGDALANMVRVQADSFVAGRDIPQAHYVLEKTWVPSFWIDRHEVTNGEYATFLEENGRAMPTGWRTETQTASRADWEKLPVVGVSLENARSYAEWAGKRLPTRLEWERAARGLNGAVFPWGNREIPADSLTILACVDQLRNNQEASLDTLAAYDLYLLKACSVGSHPADVTPDGVYDMLGGASEWVDSPSVRIVNGEVTLEPAQQCTMGSNWLWEQFSVNLWGVGNMPAVGHIAQTTIGFRCARSAEFE